MLELYLNHINGNVVDKLCEILENAGVEFRIENDLNNPKLCFDADAVGFKRYDVAPYQDITPDVMLKQFHDKFGLSYDGPPRALEQAELTFRQTCHAEEVEEYDDSATIMDQADALADLVYFAFGTAHRQGIPLMEVIRRVHAANMAKEVNPAKQRRGFDLEITKPADWKPPYLGDLFTIQPPLIGVDPAVYANFEGRAVNPVVEVEVEESVPYAGAVIDCSNLRGLICIDGPDAAGKTTLANDIAELTGGEVIHLTWTPELEAEMNYYRCSAIDYAHALSLSKVVVLERPWLSHPIYGSVYRGGVHRDKEFKMWKQQAEQKQSCAVFAMPGNPATWLKNYQGMCDTREELHGPDLQRMKNVYTTFRAAITQPQSELCPTTEGLVMYDYQMCDGAEARRAFIVDHIIPTLEKKANV